MRFKRGSGGGLGLIILAMLFFSVMIVYTMQFYNNWDVALGVPVDDNVTQIAELKGNLSNTVYDTFDFMSVAPLIFVLIFLLIVVGLFKK